MFQILVHEYVYWHSFQNLTIVRHLGHGKLEVYYMQSKPDTDNLTKFTFLPSEDYMGIG